MGTEDKRDESIGAEPAQPQRPAMTLPAAHRVRSFAERMSRIKEITGNRYNAVKNKLVAYKTVARKPKWVRPRVTNSGETFSLGRKMLGKICLVSGYLRLFLAMDPKQFNFDKYHHKDYSGVARYTQFPLMIKLSSDRQVRYALELIGILMQENGLEPDPDYVEQDYVPYFLQFAPEDGVESELWTDDDDLGFDDDDDGEEEPEGDYVEEDDVVQGAAAFAMGLAAGGADGEGAEEAAAAEPEEVSEEAAPEEALKFFNIKSPASLLCLERLRGKPGLPFVYFISYFNPAIPMSVEDEMSLPLYEILEKKYGIFVKTSKELIYARGASPAMAEKLGIEEGAPILVRKRFVLDKDNVPVEYNIGYYKADSFTYSIEFTND